MKGFVKTWFCLNEELKRKLLNRARKMSGWSVYSHIHQEMVNDALECYLDGMDDFESKYQQSKERINCTFLLSDSLIKKWIKKVPTSDHNRFAEEAIALYLEACEDLECKDE